MASWHYIQHGTMSNGMIFTRVTKLYPSYDGGLNKGDIHQFLIGMKAHDSCYSFFIPSQDCVPSPTREHETEVCLVCPINETETEINKITFICVLKRSRCSDVSSPVCWEGGFYCANLISHFLSLSPCVRSFRPPRASAVPGMPHNTPQQHRTTGAQQHSSTGAQLHSSTATQQHREIKSSDSSSSVWCLWSRPGPGVTRILDQSQCSLGWHPGQNQNQMTLGPKSAVVWDDIQARSSPMASAKEPGQYQQFFRDRASSISAVL